MAALIWFKKNTTFSNVLLGLFLLYAPITLVNNVLIYTDTIYYAYPLIYINIGFQLLTGPTLLSYFTTMMGRKIQLHWYHVLHILPALLVMLYGIQQQFIPYEQKILEVDEMRNGVSDKINIFNQVIFFHALCYFTVSGFLIRKYRSELNQYYLQTDHTKIDWINRFLLLLISISVTCILGYGLQALFFPGLYVYVDMIMLPSVTFVFYMLIMVQAFNNHSIFSTIEYQEYQLLLQPFNDFIEERTIHPVEKKYGNAALADSEMELIAQRIKILFEEKKLYLDKDINLQKLADALSLSSHHLSQYINRGTYENFSDFINYHRIEKAKRIFADSKYDNYSAEGIGQECGFKSRTTFYSAFKKHTGTTPAEFKKKLSIQA
ncbi:MAG: AraC family transcriptional regulator [Cytophagaceae bacterium]